MTGLLQDKVAVVTGGASGIGLATVERFVSEGAKVVIADIQDETGEGIAARLGANAAYVHTDVTDEQAIANAVAAAVEKYGKLDVMYNNAGAGGDPADIMDITAEGFEKTMALLAGSVLFGHKYAALQFKAQGTGGSIISTASIAGLEGAWAAVGYTTAKHAVVGIVRQAVAELAPYGIRSNAIAPGIIMTPIMAKAFGVPLEHAHPFADFLADKLGPTQPTGRVGRPDDIARVATFLASDLSEFVNGVTIPVDGGVTAITLGNFAMEVPAAAADFVSVNRL